MTDTVAYGLAIVALVPALWALAYTTIDRRVDDPLFYTVALVELALVVQLVGGSIALARTDRPVDGVTFVAYLVTVVLVPPAAAVWGIAEKSRWGTAVLAVGMLTTSVLCVRLLDIWTGRYA